MNPDAQVVTDDLGKRCSLDLRTRQLARVADIGIRNQSPERFLVSLHLVFVIEGTD